jgi:hypothetical protein
MAGIPDMVACPPLRSNSMLISRSSVRVPHSEQTWIIPFTTSCASFESRFPFFTYGKISYHKIHRLVSATMLAHHVHRYDHVFNRDVGMPESSLAFRVLLYRQAVKDLASPCFDDPTYWSTAGCQFRRRHLS